MFGKIIAILTWLACGYVCYLLAQKMGRNKILALILGLIFGWIAALVYLVLYLLKK